MNFLLTCNLIILGIYLFNPNFCWAKNITKSNYLSPYKVTFTTAIPELNQIDQITPRNDICLESKIPYSQWYSKNILKTFQSWGPKARDYPPIDDFQNKSINWKRQRVLYVAFKLIGLPYQHHHIPDWNPPKYWPWKKVAYGQNSKGLDCSNFTSWIYNYGLGIQFTSDVQKQSEQKIIFLSPFSNPIEVTTITNNSNYKRLISKLKTGDLLYICNKNKKISHVIMWVGKYGYSPDKVPLVIDCTGENHKDYLGNKIPLGVNLRPFLPNSWYYKYFSHAHRIIQ